MYKMYFISNNKPVPKKYVRRKIKWQKTKIILQTKQKQQIRTRMHLITTLDNRIVHQKTATKILMIRNR